MELLIVLLLIIINGLFAMAEIAIISARKSRLQQMANDDNANARAALELSNTPNKFLSTVQIGITLVGIFAGAFGGATIASSLSEQLQQVPILGTYSNIISLSIVVVVITYLSLIIGELVPKRLALSNPEKIASLVARPMNSISKISSPLVWLLSVSTEGVIKLLRIKQSDEPTISEEEVRMLVREGARVGVFDIAEKDIVERTLKLGDKKVNTLMTSRKEVVWLDIDSSFKSIRSTITKHPHSHFPICREGLDNVVGIVRTEDILTDFLREEKIDLQKFLHKPLFIPESMDGLKVLELFRKSGIHMALVVDEYGNVQGLVSLNDILEAIVGDIPTYDELEDKEIIKRENGSFLVDGLLSSDEFKEFFNLKSLPGEKTGLFHTVGGFVMHRLGRIPVTGDRFSFSVFSFEVVDMDGNRVDKVLVYDTSKKVKN